MDEEKKLLTLPFYVEYSDWDEQWVIKKESEEDALWFLDTDHPDQQKQAVQEAIELLTDIIVYEFQWA